MNNLIDLIEDPIDDIEDEVNLLGDLDAEEVAEVVLTPDQHLGEVAIIVNDLDQLTDDTDILETTISHIEHNLTQPNYNGLDTVSVDLLHYTIGNMVKRYKIDSDGILNMFSVENFDPNKVHNKLNTSISLEGVMSFVGKAIDKLISFLWELISRVGAWIKSFFESLASIREDYDSLVIKMKKTEKTAPKGPLDYRSKSSISEVFPSKDKLTSGVVIDYLDAQIKASEQINEVSGKTFKVVETVTTDIKDLNEKTKIKPLLHNTITLINKDLNMDETPISTKQDPLVFNTVVSLYISFGLSDRKARYELVRSPDVESLGFSEFFVLADKEQLMKIMDRGFKILDLADDSAKEVERYNSDFKLLTKQLKSKVKLFKSGKVKKDTKEIDQYAKILTKLINSLIKINSFMLSSNTTALKGGLNYVKMNLSKYK